MQNGVDGIRAGNPVVQGGTIEIDVGTNDATIEINTGGLTPRQIITVPPNKHLSVPVPPVPAGTIVIIVVGKGVSRRATYVEVVSTPP